MDTTTIMGPPEPLMSGMCNDASDAVDELAEIGSLFDDPLLSSRELGELGERYAAAWLVSRGWRVLDRNWRSRYGEIDIVAVCPERRLAFVEVKTRRTMRHGLPQEAVTAAKQANLRRAGVQWLVDPAHRIAHTGVRFDVFTVMVRDGRPDVHLIKGAF